MNSGVTFFVLWRPLSSYSQEVTKQSVPIYFHRDGRLFWEFPEIISVEIYSVFCFQQQLTRLVLLLIFHAHNLNQGSCNYSDLIACLFQEPRPRIGLLFCQEKVQKMIFCLVTACEIPDVIEMFPLLRELVLGWGKVQLGYSEGQDEPRRIISGRSL